MYRCVDSPFSIFSHTLETTERTCEYYRALCGGSQIENLERVALKFCWISDAESALLYTDVAYTFPFINPKFPLLIPPISGEDCNILTFTPVRLVEVSKKLFKYRLKTEPFLIATKL